MSLVELKFAIGAVVGAAALVARAESSTAGAEGVTAQAGGAAAGVTAAAAGLTAAAQSIIVFDRKSDTGVSDIYRVDPDGTGLRRLTRTSDNSDPAVSPDGARIAFASDRVHGSGAAEIFVMDADGGNARRLTFGFRAPNALVMNSRPAWSPDGKSLVFVRTAVRGQRSTTDLWRIPVDGGPQLRLTRHPGRESSPTFTADGMLGFERDGTIYRVRPGGLSSVRKGTEPAWAPSSSDLVFVRDGAIYAARNEGESKVADGTSPSFSPDGTRIVYAAADGLFSSTPTGSDRRRLTRSGGLSHHLTPSWGTSATRAVAAAAPDHELAFVRAGDIFTVRGDGTGVRRLTATRTLESSPAWSPDGGGLAFHRYVRGRDSDIFVMDADGRNVRRIIRDPAEELWPAWSPDGRRLAFVSTRSGAWEIYVANADGTGVRRLTHRRSGTEVNVTPAWSPDGRRIVFSSTRIPENPELYSIRPDGSGLTRLTRTAGDAETLGDDGFPSWAPNGKSIVFSSNRTGEGELWLMRPDGSGQRRLFGLPRRDDWAARFSPDGRWIAFESRPTVGSDVYIVRSDGTGLTRLAVRASSPSWRP